MSDDKTIAVPTIHLNGSSPERLMEGYMEAYKALHKALEVLGETAPNARDYYVVSDTAFTVARNQHDARMQSVKNVLEEMHALMDHVQDQIDQRDAHRARR